MKLAWRLAVAGAVFKVAIGPFMGLLFKAGLRVMLAGGPIKAVKAAFFGGFANVRACGESTVTHAVPCAATLCR